MTKRLRTCLVLAGILATIGGLACARATVAPAQEPGGLETWERTHPEASRELGIWVKQHPEAARRLFEWDGQHTDRAHALVTWAIHHPEAGVQAFAASHPEWPEADQIMREHRPAANAFLAWCRRFPEAAESLMSHPGGLDWAGRHLYAASWSMQ